MVAERRDLIFRILLPSLAKNKSRSVNYGPRMSEGLYFHEPALTIPSDGLLVFSFFLDGHWRDITVDDYLPCYPSKKLNHDDTTKPKMNKITDCFQPPSSGSMPKPRPENDWNSNSNSSGDSSSFEKEMFSLAYSKASPKHIYINDSIVLQKQLWVCYLEKAYAKSVGCYRAIHGGDIEEALQDLTGCPTEKICFSHPLFDSEETWIRLISFCSVGFPMGASSGSGRGRVAGKGDTLLDRTIVCNHAYSILEVREDGGKAHKITVDMMMDDYFGSTGAINLGSHMVSLRRHHGVVNTAAEAYSASSLTSRWIKLRNPWGVATQNSTGSSSDDDEGVFWINYHDFLVKFESIDVCKAHVSRCGDIPQYTPPRYNRTNSIADSWSFLSIQAVTAPMQFTTNKYYVVRIPEGAAGSTGTSTWLYLTVLQKTKRGSYSSSNIQRQRYWYTDSTVVVANRSTGDIIGFTSSGCKRHSRAMEVQLRPGLYGIYIFHFLPRKALESFVLRFYSSKPIVEIASDEGCSGQYHPSFACAWSVAYDCERPTHSSGVKRTKVEHDATDCSPNAKRCMGSDTFSQSSVNECQSSGELHHCSGEYSQRGRSEQLFVRTLKYTPCNQKTLLFTCKKSPSQCPSCAGMDTTTQKASTTADLVDLTEDTILSTPCYQSQSGSASDIVDLTGSDDIDQSINRGVGKPVFCFSKEELGIESTIYLHRLAGSFRVLQMLIDIPASVVHGLRTSEDTSTLTWNISVGFSGFKLCSPYVILGSSSSSSSGSSSSSSSGSSSGSGSSSLDSVNPNPPLKRCSKSFGIKREYAVASRVPTYCEGSSDHTSNIAGNVSIDTAVGAALVGDSGSCALMRYSLVIPDKIKHSEYARNGVENELFRFQVILGVFVACSLPSVYYTSPSLSSSNKAHRIFIKQCDIHIMPLSHANPAGTSIDDINISTETSDFKSTLISIFSTTNY
mgnify:CR=1 FL=1